SRGPPVRRPAGRVTHHVPGHPDPRGLVVLVVDAGVADLRRGLDDHLPVVRRVGQRLLISGHAGGEDGLAEGLALGAVRRAGERTPVLQHQDRWFHLTAFPSRTVGSPLRKVATMRPGRVVPAYGVLRLRLGRSGGATTRRGAGASGGRLAG